MSRGLRDSEVVPSDRGVVPSDLRQAVGVEGHSWGLGRPSAESFHPGECPHVDKHQAGQEMGPGQALPLLPACAYSCLPRPASGRAVDLRCQLALGLTLSWLPGFRPPGSALGAATSGRGKGWTRGRLFFSPSPRRLCLFHLTFRQVGPELCGPTCCPNHLWSGGGGGR